MIIEVTAYTEQDELVEAEIEVLRDRYDELTAKLVSAHMIVCGKPGLPVDRDRLILLGVWDELMQDAFEKFDPYEDDAIAIANQADSMLDFLKEG